MCKLKVQSFPYFLRIHTLKENGDVFEKMLGVCPFTPDIVSIGYIKAYRLYRLNNHVKREVTIQEDLVIAEILTEAVRFGTDDQYAWKHRKEFPISKKIDKNNLTLESLCFSRIRSIKSVFKTISTTNEWTCKLIARIANYIKHNPGLHSKEEIYIDKEEVYKTLMVLSMHYPPNLTKNTNLIKIFFMIRIFIVCLLL